MTKEEILKQKLDEWCKSPEKSFEECLMDAMEQYSASQQGGMREFLRWLGNQKDFQWDGEKWSENTGHDDFEELSMIEIFYYWKENVSESPAEEGQDEKPPKVG